MHARVRTASTSPCRNRPCSGFPESAMDSTPSTQTGFTHDGRGSANAITAGSGAYSDGTPSLHWLCLTVGGKADRTGLHDAMGCSSPSKHGEECVPQDVAMYSVGTPPACRRWRRTISSWSIRPDLCRQSDRCDPVRQRLGSHCRHKTVVGIYEVRVHLHTPVVQEHHQPVPLVGDVAQLLTEARALRDPRALLVEPHAEAVDQRRRIRPPHRLARHLPRQSWSLPWPRGRMLRSAVSLNFQCAVKGAFSQWVRFPTGRITASTVRRRPRHGVHGGRFRASSRGPSRATVTRSSSCARSSRPQSTSWTRSSISSTHRARRPGSRRCGPPKHGCGVRTPRVPSNPLPRQSDGWRSRTCHGNRDCRTRRPCRHTRSASRPEPACPTMGRSR